MNINRNKLTARAAALILWSFVAFFAFSNHNTPHVPDHHHHIHKVVQVIKHEEVIL